MLFLADSCGMPFVCSDLVSGNHHNAFELVKTVKNRLIDFTCRVSVLTAFFSMPMPDLKRKTFTVFIPKLKFLVILDTNTRNGAEGDCLFDELLFINYRFVIEKTNVWMDAFKTMLIRFETNAIHWKDLIIMAFMFILLRKL